jgi:hypothetical protein
MKRFGFLIFMGVFLVSALAGPALAKDPPCPVCGSEVGGAKFTVTQTSGKETVYSCPRCALLDADVQGAKSLKATDFLTRKPVDGRKAFYLVGTSFGDCCPPFWLSFAEREDAEKFGKGFGGRVLTFEEALRKLGK